MVLTEKMLNDLLAERDAAKTPQALAEWDKKTQAIIHSMSESDTLQSMAAIGRLLDAMEWAILEANRRAAMAA